MFETNNQDICVHILNLSYHFLSLGYKLNIIAHKNHPNCRQTHWIPISPHQASKKEIDAHLAPEMP